MIFAHKIVMNQYLTHAVFSRVESRLILSALLVGLFILTACVGSVAITPLVSSSNSNTQSFCDTNPFRHSCDQEKFETARDKIIIECIKGGTNDLCEDATAYSCDLNPKGLGCDAEAQNSCETNPFRYSCSQREFETARDEIIDKCITGGTDVLCQEAADYFCYLNPDDNFCKGEIIVNTVDIPVSSTPEYDCDSNPFNRLCTVDPVARQAFCRDNTKITDTKTDDCADTITGICRDNPFDTLCTEDSVARLAFCRDDSKNPPTKTTDCADIITGVCMANRFDPLCTVDFHADIAFCRDVTKTTATKVADCAYIITDICRDNPFDRLCTVDLVARRAFCRDGSKNPPTKTTDCADIITGVCRDNPFDPLCSHDFEVELAFCRDVTKTTATKVDDCFYIVTGICRDNPFDGLCTVDLVARRAFCRDDTKTGDTKTDDCMDTIKGICRDNPFDRLCTVDPVARLAFCRDTAKITATKTTDCADTITGVCTNNPDPFDALCPADPIARLAFCRDTSKTTATKTADCADIIMGVCTNNPDLFDALCPRNPIAELAFCRDNTKTTATKIIDCASFTTQVCPDNPFNAICTFDLTARTAFCGDNTKTTATKTVDCACNVNPFDIRCSPDPVAELAFCRDGSKITDTKTDDCSYTEFLACQNNPFDTFCTADPVARLAFCRRGTNAVAHAGDCNQIARPICAENPNDPICPDDNSNRVTAGDWLRSFDVPLNIDPTGIDQFLQIVGKEISTENLEYFSDNGPTLTFADIFYGGKYKLLGIGEHRLLGLDADDGLYIVKANFYDGKNSNSRAYNVNYVGILGTTDLGAPIIDDAFSATWFGDIAGSGDAGSGIFRRKNDFSVTLTFDGTIGTIDGLVASLFSNTPDFLIDGTFDASGVITGFVHFAKFTRGVPRLATERHGILSGIIGQEGVVAVFRGISQSYFGGFVASPVAGACVKNIFDAACPLSDDDFSIKRFCNSYNPPADCAAAILCINNPFDTSCTVNPVKHLAFCRDDSRITDTKTADCADTIRCPDNPFDPLCTNDPIVRLEFCRDDTKPTATKAADCNRPIFDACQNNPFDTLCVGVYKKRVAEKIEFCHDDTKTTDTKINNCADTIIGICNDNPFDALCAYDPVVRLAFCGDNSKTTATKQTDCICNTNPFGLICTADPVAELAFCRQGTNATDIANCAGTIGRVCTDNPNDPYCPDDNPNRVTAGDWLRSFDAPLNIDPKEGVQFLQIVGKTINLAGKTVNPAYEPDNYGILHGGTLTFAELTYGGQSLGMSTDNGLAYYSIGLIRGSNDIFSGVGIFDTTDLGAPITDATFSATWYGIRISYLTKYEFNLNVTFNGTTGTLDAFIVRNGRSSLRIDGDFDASGVITGIFKNGSETAGSLTGIIGQDGVVGVFGAMSDYDNGGFIASPVAGVCAENIFDTACPVRDNFVLQVEFCRDDSKTTATKTADCMDTITGVCTDNPFDMLCTVDSVARLAFCRDTSKTTTTKAADCADIIAGVCTNTPALFDALCPPNPVAELAFCRNNLDDGRCADYVINFSDWNGIFSSNNISTSPNLGNGFIAPDTLASVFDALFTDNKAINSNGTGGAPSPSILNLADIIGGDAVGGVAFYTGFNTDENLAERTYHAGISRDTILGTVLPAWVSGQPVSANWTGKFSAVQGANSVVTADFTLEVNFKNNRVNAFVQDGSSANYYYLYAAFNPQGMIDGTVNYGTFDAGTRTPTDGRTANGILTGLIGEQGAIGVFISGTGLSTTTSGGTGDDGFAGGFIAKPPQ